MAWGRVVVYPGGTEEQYRAVVEAIGPAFDNPPGRLFHTAGATAHGWMMITIWESQEDFMRFAQENLGRAHEAAGDRGWKSPPEATDFDLFHTFPGLNGRT